MTQLCTAIKTLECPTISYNGFGGSMRPGIMFSCDSQNGSMCYIFVCMSSFLLSSKAFCFYFFHTRPNASLLCLKEIKETCHVHCRLVYGNWCCPLPWNLSDLWHSQFSIPQFSHVATHWLFCRTIVDIDKFCFKDET